MKTIKKGILELGKLDRNGEKTGTRNCLATLEWELRETEKGPEFSMSGNLWNHIKTDIVRGGQCCDDLAAKFPHNKKAQRMVEVWNLYHLNGLKAGCKHQRAAKWEDVRIDPAELPNSRANQDSKGILAIWVYEKEHKAGLLCKPCPKCGYKYGSAWLYEPIPENIINEILSW